MILLLRTEVLLFKKIVSLCFSTNIQHIMFTTLFYIIYIFWAKQMNMLLIQFSITTLAMNRQFPIKKLYLQNVSKQ